MKNLSSNPAVNVLKNLGSSPLFLVATILYSVSAVVVLVLSILGDGDNGSTYWSVYSDYSYSMGDPNAQYSTRLSIGSELINVLIAVGMWLHYAACQNARSGNVSTSGLTMCKVLQIISLVVTCVVCLILLVGGILLAVFADAIASDIFLDPDLLLGLGIGMALGAVIAAPLVIFYMAGVLKIICRMKKTAVTGVPDDRISGYVIGMNWVCAVLGIVGTLWGFAYSAAMGNGFSLVSLLSSICSSVALILIALCLSRYKKEMRILMYPPVQPVYAQPYQEPVQPSYQAGPAPQPYQESQPYQAPQQPAQPPVPPQAPQTSQDEKPNE